MTKPNPYGVPRVIATIVLASWFTASATGCHREANPQTAAVPTDQTSQATTAPPPGDSTPKAVDGQASVVNGANEKPRDAGSGSQTTVGTAASGAPPYSLQGAPEGNPSPKGGEAVKK